MNEAVEEKYMRSVLAFFTISVVASFALAQQTALTRINGYVRDENGGRVASVRITFTDERNREFQVISEEDGSYSIHLPAGNYSLSAMHTEQNAWNKFELEKVEVPFNTMKTFHIVLAVNQKWVKANGSELIGSVKEASEVQGKSRDNKGVTLSGTVFDRNGAVVPGVEIIATSANGTYRTITNSDGTYSLLIQKGVFSVEFRTRYDSFCPKIVKNYDLVESMNLDMVMDSGPPSHGSGKKCKTKTIKF